MKHLYVILWVISSFFGTGLLSNELQEDDLILSSDNHFEYVKPHFTGQKFQHHSITFFDFDFEYLFPVNKKSIQPPVSGDVINIYCFIFTTQTLKSPLLYDLPPPNTMV